MVIFYLGVMVIPYLWVHGDILPLSTWWCSIFRFMVMLYISVHDDIFTLVFMVMFYLVGHGVVLSVFMVMFYLGMHGKFLYWCSLWCSILVFMMFYFGIHGKVLICWSLRCSLLVFMVMFIMVFVGSFLLKVVCPPSKLNKTLTQFCYVLIVPRSG